MRQISVAVLLALFVSSSPARAQSPDQSVPRLINITGVFRPADGQPPAAVETVTLAIYADEQGGAPLWQETHTVNIDDRGRYSLLLGAVSGGIPVEIFGSGDAHWLGTRFERAAEVEGSRVRLTSVPYALRAAAADTLGGRPASDYQLTSGATTDGKTATAATRSDVAGPTGTANFLPKYVDSVNFGDSALYEVGGQVGLGTTTPFDIFHVRYTNTGGNLTGFAVQNMGNTATSYSGMLFYDQNNQLGQFQGFNNVTHEYRINNVARNGGGQFDGSINFMLGGASKFIVAPNGNIGIGTTSPSALLEVSNVVPGGPANMWMTSYTNAINPYYMARRARGTPAAPTAVQTGDGLAGFYGEGYGTTAFGGGFAGGMTVQAAQNWTDAARGTQISFTTTANGSTTSSPRMLIANSGMVGIGTNFPVSNLEVSNALSGTTFGVVTATSFGNTTGASLFIGNKARGTSAAPLAVQGGDVLAGFLARGFFSGTTSGFSATRGGMFVGASENWTDTAQGTSLFFNTTPNGTITPSTKMTITDNGNVGIGTLFPGDALEVSRTGDDSVVVATAFTNGNDATGVFLGRTARGTQAAPTATQQGDVLGALVAQGFGTTDFSNDVQVGVAGFAAENFTDTAHGSSLVFGNTPLGGANLNIVMALLPSGFLGIGTPPDAFGVPTATDRLQVFGDARVGNAGTNGCLKRFDGTGLIGTCASDRRFKKDITPFAPALDKVTALQPVHYFWRASDFPDRHFGTGQTYGLIAQDVAQVLPELVATDSDGYKAIDYSKLPLLTIQAMKELKAENDTLKERVTELEPLKQRVAELERLLTEMLAASGRR
jgi:endosialidase-like protein